MRWVVVVLLSGCSSILGIEDFKLGDAGTDSSDAAGGYCLGPDGWRVCLESEPTMPLTVTQSLNLDTRAGQCAPNQPPSWKAAGQPDACFLIASDVTFDAPIVHAAGERPLVVFASGTITINTQLDVASHSTVTGAGSPSMACGTAGAGTNSASATSPAGGGAGGSFMGRGGQGGTSSSNIAGGMPAGALTQPPMLLRGGCNGGAGGSAQNGNGGAPGRGGGAVYLVAGTAIRINGFINASGSGGDGGGIASGGGGGGSGGMIVLHAPDISGTSGVVMANGGGGGGGGGGNQSGGAGREPSPQMPSTPAEGGFDPSGAISGGIGFAGTTLAGSGRNGPTGSSFAGGGGGGAQGYIRANRSLSQINQSPAATIVQ